LNQISQSLQAANVSREAGGITTDNRQVSIHSGDFLANPEDVGNLMVGIHKNAVVDLKEVADIQLSSNGTDQ
jgi:multidrug efflux pump subunit AcrB